MVETSAEVFKMNKKEVKLVQKLSTQLNDRDLNHQVNRIKLNFVIIENKNLNQTFVCIKYTHFYK